MTGIPRRSKWTSMPVLYHMTSSSAYAIAELWSRQCCWSACRLCLPQDSGKHWLSGCSVQMAFCTLQVFLAEHQPTYKSGKPQYKSAIWTQSREQEDLARAALHTYAEQHKQEVMLDCRLVTSSALSLPCIVGAEMRIHMCCGRLQRM